MKKHLKTGLFLLLAVVLIIAGKPIVFASTLPAELSVNSYGVYTDSSSTEKLSKVEEGLTYCIKFYVLNYSQSNISDVTLSVANAGGFSEVNSAASFDIAANSSTEVPVYVAYNGDNKYLTLTLRYSIGADTYSRTQKINISEAVVEVTSDNSSDDDTDTVVPTPKLSVMSRDVSVTAGQQSTISFSLNNNSGYTAKSVVAMLQPGSGIEDIFADAADSAYKNSISSLTSGKSQIINFTFTPPADLKGGSYPMTLNLTYRNANGTSYSDQYEFSLKIDSNTTPIDLGVVSVKVSGNNNQAVSGKTFDLQMNIKNNGSATAKNVKVSFDELSKDTFFRTGDYNDPSFSSIPGSQTVTGSVRLSASDDLESGYTPLKITLKYLDAGEEKSITCQVFVPVSGSGGGGGENAVPRIILSKYSMDRSAISAGDIFAFSFSLQNTSLSKAVNNLKISVSSGDGVIIPNSGSNSFFTRSIQPGKDASYRLELSVKADAESKSYPLTFNIDYEDSKGTQLTSSETISLPVMQPQKLVIQNQSYPTEGNVGSPASVSLEYINKGKGTLYNLSVSIEGDVTTDEGGSIYIGNLASGSMDSLEMDITPNTVGEIPCKVVFTFEDSSGQESRIEEPFTMTVAEAIPQDEGAIDALAEAVPPQVGGGLPGWAIAAIVAAAVVATVLIIKHKKKKARLAQEAEDAEDNEDTDL